MLQKLKNLFLGKYLGSLVRHGFSLAAGFLAAKGIVQSPETLGPWVSQSSDIVVALVLYLLAQGASIAQKQLK